MPNPTKFEAVAEIKAHFDSASTTLLVDYRGLSVKEMQALRVKLREAGVDLKIYKNSLTEIALRELEMPDLGTMLEGPTAFAFSQGDPVTNAKALSTFAKEHTALELKGGLVDGAIVDAAQVTMLATLPSREELVAKLMGMLTSPVRGFMGMANAPAGAFVRTMKAVADQRAAA
jgi:large subunit ribosomal protein L10